MKKAKVSKGIVHHVWPWVKTLADGTEAVKEFPDCYKGLNGKPVPECIVDVPDDVQPGWMWDGEKYAPRPKVASERKTWKFSIKDLIREEIAKALRDLNGPRE